MDEQAPADPVQPLSDAQGPDPVGALERGWGCHDRSVSGAHLGVSRLTWKVDGLGWLSAVQLAEEPELTREHRLLAQIGPALAELGMAVPQPVPTVDGSDRAVVGPWCWRLTSHLAGRSPDVDEADEYRGTTAGLARIHRVMGALDRSLAVRSPGIGELVRRGLDLAPAWSSSPLARQSGEGDAVARLADWLRSRVDQLTETQLVHGDWATPNLLVQGSGKGLRLVGVLDWQDVAVGSPLMDLAQAASSALMWSGRPDPAPSLHSILEGYQAGGGPAVGLDHLAVGVAAYWLAQYARLRQRADGGGFDPHLEGILERNPKRLASALAFALAHS